MAQQRKRRVGNRNAMGTHGVAVDKNCDAAEKKCIAEGKHSKAMNRYGKEPLGGETIGE